MSKTLPAFIKSNENHFTTSPAIDSTVEGAGEFLFLKLDTADGYWVVTPAGLAIDGSQLPGVVAGSANYTPIPANFAVTDVNRGFIITAPGSINITLPATPAFGTWLIFVTDVDIDPVTNPITLLGNGQLICNTTQLVINVRGAIKIAFGDAGEWAIESINQY